MIVLLVLAVDENLVFFSQPDELFVEIQQGIRISFKEGSVKFKAPKGYDLNKGKLVLSNYSDNRIVNNGFVTKPYEVRVYMF